MKTKLILVFTVLLALAAGVQAAEPIGKVVSIQGSVSAAGTDGVERPLALNAEVFQNDTIKTGPDAKIQLMFTDDTLFAQGANSEAELTEYIFSPKKAENNAMGMKLGLGVFRVITGKITDLNPDRFKVKTGRATIGIRGCELGFNNTRNADRVFIVRVPQGRRIVIDEIRDLGAAGEEPRAPRIDVEEQNVLYVIEDGVAPERRTISPDDLLELYEETSPNDMFLGEEDSDSAPDADANVDESGEPDGEQDADSSAGESDETQGETPAAEEAPDGSTDESQWDGYDSTMYEPVADQPATEPGTGVEGAAGTDPFYDPFDDGALGNEPEPDSTIVENQVEEDNGADSTADAGTVADGSLALDPGTGDSTLPADNTVPSDNTTVVDPIIPTPGLRIKGGGIGALYMSGSPNNLLQDIWVYKDLVGTMDNVAFDGRILGFHDNFMDSLTPDAIERFINVPLSDYMPGSTTYMGYDEVAAGGTTIANDNLLQFWRRVDNGDFGLALSYGGYPSSEFTGAHLPADSVVKYDILFTEFPPMRPMGDPLTPMIENGSLWVNTRTGDFLVQPAASPGLQGNAAWLQFFGQEMQGVGHVVSVVDTSGQGGGMCLAGFQATTASAITPAETGVTAHHGGYAVGVTFCETPAGGSPIRAHNFYSGEGNVSAFINRDTLDNNAMVMINAFQNPASPNPADIHLGTPDASFYVMGGMYEAHYNNSPQFDGLVRGDVDSGTDWGWGEWNGQRTVDYGSGPQTEQVEGRYVTGRTLTPADYNDIFQGAASFDMTGSGSAMGYIGNNDYRSRVDGMATIHILIPGGSAPAMWDGAFSLNNANGDTLVINYSPLSQNISSGGNLSSSVTPSFYELQTGFLVTSPLIEHQMDGSLVGPGIGANPITGAIGSGNFRHLDGHFSEFTYGTDLH